MVTDKITVTIPHNLKKKLVNIKNELNISMSAIYREALQNYLEKKELERWEEGAILASKNKEYIKHSKEIGNTGLDICEY